MKRIFCISIFLLFLISVHAEEFLFKEFEIGESFSTVSLQMKSYSSLKPLEEHFYATDIFSNKNIRKKLVFGFSNNSLNLIVEYFSVQSEEEFLNLKEKIENYLNSSYKWEYSNNHQSWKDRNRTIRTFSSKIQMDGKDGYTYWIMYAGKIEWDAYKYIYEPFKFNKTPSFPKEVPIVYWEMNKDIVLFSNEHKDLKLISDGKYRKIVEKNSNPVYIDYSFSNGKLSNIALNFEFKTREEQKSFFNNLMLKYSATYGEGNFESYDKNLYQNYIISDSKLIIGTQIAISYCVRNYVLDQLNKDMYLVSLIFINY